MKKKRILTIAFAVAALVILVGILFKSDLFERKLSDVTSENGYTISNQEKFDVSISFQKSSLPDAIYSSDGYTFAENEVVVYQTETTSIYLEKVMLANEGDDQLYFIFNFCYDLPESGSVLIPYQKTERGGYTNFMDLRSRNLTDTTDTYPETVGLRAHGPGEQFTFYVSTDACKKAAGTMTIEAFCSQLTYEKNK